MELYGSALARVLEIVDAPPVSKVGRTPMLVMKRESRALWIVCGPISAPTAATSSSSA